MDSDRDYYVFTKCHFHFFLVVKLDYILQLPLKSGGVMQWSFGHGMWEKVIHIAFRIGI